MYNPIIQKYSNKFGNNRWKSFSVKIQRNVFLFSDLEYDNWLLTECNPRIISFCEQPFEIKIPFNSEIRTSIPDMWILYDNGDEEIVEVKYMIELNKPRVIEQIGIQKEWCKVNNFKHKVLTDHQIRESSILLSNNKIIIKMLKHKTDIDYNAQTKIVSELQACPRVSISELSVLLSMESRSVLETVAYLIFKGDICADLMEKHFGLKTEVWLKHEEQL